MDKNYKIIRINTGEKTVTVMMTNGDHALQQDVPVDDFTDKAAIIANVEAVYAKYTEDITAARQAQEVVVSPDVQSLIDQEITIS